MPGLGPVTGPAAGAYGAGVETHVRDEIPATPEAPRAASGLWWEWLALTQTLNMQRRGLTGSQWKSEGPGLCPGYGPASPLLPTPRLATCPNNRAAEVLLLCRSLALPPNRASSI